MKKAMYFLLTACLILVGACEPKLENPNIIFILADDLGYGGASKKSRYPDAKN